MGKKYISTISTAKSCFLSHCIAPLVCFFLMCATDLICWRRYLCLMLIQFSWSHPRCLRHDYTEICPNSAASPVVTKNSAKQTDLQTSLFLNTSTSENILNEPLDCLNLGEGSYHTAVVAFVYLVMYQCIM